MNLIKYLRTKGIKHGVEVVYKYKLDNLCLIVDNNNLQIDGSINEVKGLDNIEGKFKSFGFNTIVINRIFFIIIIKNFCFNMP